MKIWWIPVVALSIAVAGCSGGKKDDKEPADANDQAQQTTPVEKPAGTDPAAKPPESPAAKPAEPRPSTPRTETVAATKLVTLSSGYAFEARLDEKISTETHAAGRSFQASLSKPAILKTEGEVFPAGSKIRGEVTFSKRAERVGGKADLTLEFRELVAPDGKSYPIFTEPMVLEGKGTAEGDIEKTVGGAVGGAIIGGILGGKGGAVKGGAAGGAAGAAWAIATRGNDIVIDPGQVLEIRLVRALRVTIMARQGTALP